MEVGDLVKHNPDDSDDPHIRELYIDTGPNFKIGIVIRSRDSFRWIMPERGKPSWYQVEELKVISKS